VVEAPPAKVVSFVTHDSHSTRNRTSTPLSFLENTLDQSKSCFRKCDELVLNCNVWNPLYSLFDLRYTNRPQKTIAYSERFCSPKHDCGSEPQQVPSPTIQQRKVEREWESRNLKEQVIRSTTFGALNKAESLPQRHVSRLSSALRNSERTLSPVAQNSSQLRRLSPLRECSVNSHHSAEIEQQSLGRYFLFLQSNGGLCKLTSCTKDLQRSQISLASTKAIRYTFSIICS